MKLVIPAQFQMGCRFLKIRLNDNLLKELDSKAQLDDKHDLVRMSKRSNLSMWESLVHEMLHEAHYFCGDGDISEGKILALAGFLSQSILSLGIEPDFSQIPEELAGV